MFVFIIRYFGFLKFVPGLALLFDAQLKLWTLIANPNLLDWIDDIEKEVLTWPGTTVTNHKYGGLQFNYHGKELGHIHSNGLLDMLLSRKIKQQLMQQDRRVQDHHSFKNSGWISVYLKYHDDKHLAIELFEHACKLHADKALNN
ncbi:MAG: luciferase family protein [Bacteroidota bacterium]